MLGLSWVANMFPHMVKQLLTGDLLLYVFQDFQGQRLAEQLFQYIILLFGVSYYNKYNAIPIRQPIQKFPYQQYD